MKKLFFLIALLCIWAIPAHAYQVNVDSGWNYVWEGVYGGENVWGQNQTGMPHGAGIFSDGSSSTNGSPVCQNGYVYKQFFIKPGKQTTISINYEWLLSDPLRPPTDFAIYPSFGSIFLQSCEAGESYYTSKEIARAEAWSVYGNWLNDPNYPGGRQFLGTVKDMVNNVDQTSLIGYGSNPGTFSGSSSITKTFTCSPYGSSVYVFIELISQNYGQNQYWEDYYFRATSMDITTVPEPGSIIALGSGLLGLVGFAVRRKTAK